MWDGYLTAIEETIRLYPESTAKTVIDRFHVAQNYRKAFDKLRKKEFKRMKKVLSEEEYEQFVKGKLWLLRRNHQDLSECDRAHLRQLFVFSPKLHQAYTLREELTALLNTNFSLEMGEKRLQDWIDKVEKSSVSCFDSFLKTLRRHFSGIVAYFERRASSGFVEGLNTKLKLITRRSYGGLKASSLFQRLWLDIQGREILLG